MRPITRLLILLLFILVLNEFLSLIRGNDALHKTAITQAYYFAVQLARRNEEKRELALAMGGNIDNLMPSTEDLQNTAIRNLSYERGGAIHIELNASSGVDGGVLVYLPLMKNGRIAEWTCITHDYPSIRSFLPACQYIE